jgi:hypothetical protein
MRTYRVTVQPCIEDHIHLDKLANPPAGLDIAQRPYWIVDSLEKARRMVACFRMVGYVNLVRVTFPSNLEAFEQKAKCEPRAYNY